MADPVQLEIALLNLAMNARDAMPRGGELTIATECVTVNAGAPRGPALPPGDYLRVSAIDTGEGMSEEVRARALEPFFTTKGMGKGTGLGLSMVFGFASLMGGTVTLDSAPGAGTTVSLYLPRAIVAAPPGEDDAATAAIAPVDAAPMGAARILLIDDDETVRTTTRGMLEDMGLAVMEAGSGADALALLATDRSFDLLVIDFAMPDMNGNQCATQIRALWPDAPLLFVTGYVENDGLRHWVELGVPTLRKPFTLQELSAALSSSIGRAAPASARVIPFRAAGI
jgi:CheY-like chemotaxis protein